MSAKPAPGPERLEKDRSRTRAGVVRDIIQRGTDDNAQLGTPVLLPLDQIDSSPLNPRSHFDEAALDELAKSLEADGLLQPILVRRAAERFAIIAGERRWRAARQLGWQSIAAVVRDNVDDQTMIRLALLENLARTDLDPLEEAEGYRRLQDLGMTQVEIAAAVHRSQPAIANAIRLLRLPEPVRERIQSGQLTASHGVVLLRYAVSPKLVEAIAEQVVEDGVTSKELEQELPDKYSLAQRGLIRDLSYGARFDTKICDQCPFDARRKSGTYGDYCLNPDHYEQLQTEAEVKRQAEAQRQVQKAKASGKKVPKLSDLGYGAYERIPSTPPEGCSEHCTCRGAALDYSNEVVQICTDPKQFKKLQSADARKANADKQAQLKELLDRLNDKLDLLPEFSERELAIVAAATLRNLQTPDYREAVKWAGGVVDVKDLEDFQLRDTLPQALARLTASDLVRMLVYTVLHHELRNAIGGYGTGKHPWSDWYLADEPPHPTGKRLLDAFAPKPDDRPRFDPDHRIADEIAAEQERLQTEYAEAGATA